MDARGAGSPELDASSARAAEELGPAFDPAELSPVSEWREVSDGGYSEVYKARLLGATVAVKAATLRKKTSGESLLREIRYLRQSGPHPNIVQVYGAFSEARKLHLVLEFARHCLRSDRVARSCDPVVVLAGVARALVRIHRIGIVHRDLKTRNVLVAAENRALLIDFGLACHLQQDGSEWVGRTVGTKKYRPPEMRDGRRAHPSMDIFCFGLMIEKLLKQRRDRGGSHSDSPHSDAGRHERRDCRLLLDVSQQCTARDPTERPTAWSILLRLQRHVGEETARCDAPRERVPLAPQPRQQAAGASANGERERHGRAERERGGDPERKRRRTSSEAAAREASDAPVGSASAPGTSADPSVGR